MAVQAPVDYFGQLTGEDLGTVLTNAFQESQQKRVALAQQQRAVTQQQQLDQAKANAIANPSGASYRALMVLDPAGSEASKRAFDSLDSEQRNRKLEDGGAVYGHLMAGNIPQAKAIIQRHIDADKKAGLDTSQDQGLLDVIDSPDQGPRHAAAAMGYDLAGLVGAEKFDSMFGKVGDAARADAKLPGEIAKTGAETQKLVTDTEIAPQVAAAQIGRMESQTANEAARLGLDRERLQADIAQNAARLEFDQTNVPAAAVGAINSAVGKAASARQLAERANGLADQLIEKNASGGVGAGLAGMLTGLTGNASDITQLRREYTQIRGAQAVKNLPPGPASDKDIQLALKGFPSENASGETLASFLRGMAKLQNVVADSADRESEWLAGNRGSLGPAKQGFFVGNDFVAPGTKYTDIEKRYSQQRATQAAADRVGK